MLIYACDFCGARTVSDDITTVSFTINGKTANRNICEVCLARVVYGSSKPDSLRTTIIQRKERNRITNADIANIMGYTPNAITRMLLRPTTKLRKLQEINLAISLIINGREE